MPRTAPEGLKAGSPAARRSPLAAGLALRLLATALFALMALCVRLASVEAPVGQIMFWRSAVALLPIVLYLVWRGELSAVRTRRPGLHARRSLYGGAAMFFSFASIALLPLSLATALAFLAPVVTIPAAALLLRERPSGAALAAAGLGFGGVLLMLTPALAEPEAGFAALVGVGAGVLCAATTAMAKVEIKRLTEAGEATGAIAFHFALASALLALLTMPFAPWTAIAGAPLVWLAGAGLCGGLAHIAMTEAIARAPVSTLAPLEYTAMLWALGFDLLAFGVFPGVAGLAGAAAILAGAVLVARQGDRG